MDFVTTYAKWSFLDSVQTISWRLDFWTIPPINFGRNLNDWLLFQTRWCNTWPRNLNYVGSIHLCINKPRIMIRDYGIPLYHEEYFKSFQSRMHIKLPLDVKTIQIHVVRYACTIVAIVWSDSRYSTGIPMQCPWSTWIPMHFWTDVSSHYIWS